MTFESLIHISPWMAALQIFLIGLGGASLVGVFSFLFFQIFVRGDKKMDTDSRTDLRNYFWIMAGFAFIFGVLIGGIAVNQVRIAYNESAVRANLSQKYVVEEVVFGPRGRGVPNIAYPEQSEPQKITIKSDGKSRLAILTQDRETSEPTLTDVDNGQPMDDILKH
jgi:hypothetical protein